jgi:hypothetical protein
MQAPLISSETSAPHVIPAPPAASDNGHNVAGHPPPASVADGMNEIARFLTLVVPWPAIDGDGYINLHYTQARAADGKVFWFGKPTKAVAEAVALVERLVRQPNVRDIYFCLSRQRATKLNQYGTVVAARSRDNAVALTSIWLDIDVKDPPKGYASLQEAVRGLQAFEATVGLPPPSALVFSGGGLHVYWSSTKVFTPDEWRPLAERLKNAALQHGLRCDAGCTTDRARILRVPGTFNWKNGEKRPVKLMRLGTPYDFDGKTYEF